MSTGHYENRDITWLLTSRFHAAKAPVADPRWLAVLLFKLEILPPAYSGFPWWC